MNVCIIRNSLWALNTFLSIDIINRYLFRTIHAFISIFVNKWSCQRTFSDVVSGYKVKFVDLVVFFWDISIYPITCKLIGNFLVFIYIFDISKFCLYSRFNYSSIGLINWTCWYQSTFNLIQVEFCPLILFLKLFTDCTIRRFFSNSIQLFLDSIKLAFNFTDSLIDVGSFLLAQSFAFSDF